MRKTVQCNTCSAYHSGVCKVKNKAVIGDRVRTCSHYRLSRKKVKGSSTDDLLDYRSVNVSYSDMNTLS